MSVYPQQGAMVPPEMQAAAQRPQGEWRFGLFDCFGDFGFCNPSSHPYYIHTPIYSYTFVSQRLNYRPLHSLFVFRIA